MATKRKLDIEGLASEDRVHQSIFTNPETFNLEMEKIYSRSWVYVAHESEVAQGGDYKTAYLGSRPIIVTRSPDDGQVRALFNRCRHRGATVCQFEAGNSAYFRCAYHGWTYNNAGKLVGVPYRQGYGPDFAPGDLGLVPSARVESYQGFIFACMNPETQSLEEYLGKAKEYIDIWTAQSPLGRMALKSGNTRYAFNGNWKMQMENTVDVYHFDFVHEDWEGLMTKRIGKTYRVSTQYSAIDLGNGHSVIVQPSGGPMVGPGFVMNIFPNLEFLWTQVRVIRPVAVNRTEVALYYSVPEGTSGDVTSQRLTEHVNGFGPVGNIGPNDMEMFERCQAGYQTGLEESALYLRGYTDVEKDRRSNTARETESPQRAFYREWRRLMQAG